MFTSGLSALNGGVSHLSSWLDLLHHLTLLDFWRGDYVMCAFSVNEDFIFLEVRAKN